eukprot:s1151_g12.t1
MTFHLPHPGAKTSAIFRVSFRQPLQTLMVSEFSAGEPSPCGPQKEDSLRKRAAGEDDELDELDELDQDMNLVRQDLDEVSQEEGPEERPARPKPKLIGEHAGFLPDSSHSLVEQLMAQYAQLQEEEEEDTEAAVAEAKAAANAAFRKAEALDVASDDAMLNYERVVQTRRNRESAELLQASRDLYCDAC